MPAGEPYYRFCDLEEYRKLLVDAGFDRDSVAMEALPLIWRFTDAEALFDLFRAATTRSALVLAAQREETLQAIRDAFASKVARWRTGSGDFAIPHAAVLVSASR
jgi:hypothetical protein